MNSVNSKSAKSSIKGRSKALLLTTLLVALPASAWEIDFSRRQTDFSRVTNDDRLPASTKSSEPAGLLERALEPAEPAQDLVIINTEKGFVPEAIYLRKGATYRISVVNVNPKQKNASFVFDAFSENHNIVFGQVKSFTVSPKADGVFTYQCPETAMQGRAVIAAPESDRKPASR